jgi:outer membrane murein-binding lipoprotein Lpp
MTFGVKHHQEELTKAVRDGSLTLQGTVSDVKKLLLESTQTTNQEINAHVKQLSEKTTEEIRKLDQALERELTKAISSLGSQLTSLSNKFVEDYTPLTQRLRELVQSAKGV